MILLILVMLGVLVLVVATALLLMAHAILRPPRMSDGKALYLLKRLSPADLGMQFENVRFAVRDERSGRDLQLAGWWIPHPAGGDKTVILIHGYADAKVGAIAWAPTWRQIGFHILAIDLRAHGESDGIYSTGGVFEQKDLDQIINQLRATRPAQTRQLVLFGISLGASVALGAAEARDDISAIVLESPIANFRHAVRAQATMLELPLLSMLPQVLKLAEWICGARFDQLDPLRSIVRVKCPVMAIQSGDDPFVPPEDARRIEDAVKARPHGSVSWVTEHVPHLLTVQANPDEYRRRIEQFLQGIYDAERI
ncbi:MAG TPA: alpha/beta fold hydrolase [Tepidisphaeraceae bacterium]